MAARTHPTVAWHRTGWTATLGALACAVVTAQQPVFRSGIEAVRVEVSVTRNGVPVQGLGAGNFEILDSGLPQAIDRVSREDIPLNLLLVLDTSGSMAGPPLSGLIDAAQGLVRSLSPTDRVGLLTFSQRIDLRVPPTVEHQRVLASLGGIAAAGPTSLRDALFAGLHALAPDVDSRPVVIVFSDGRDTASWTPAAHLEDVVRRSGVVLHAVELVDPAQSRRRPSGIAASRSLQRALVVGGGRLWQARKPEELPDRFASVLGDLRARYLVTYTPRGVSASGWHDVTVRLKGVRGDLHARPGYFVP